MTKGEEYFTKFFKRIKNATNDMDILYAGWQLVEDYRGYKSETISQSAKQQFKKIIEKNGKSKN